MCFQRTFKKIKKSFCFLIIISLLLTLFFPQFVSSQDTSEVTKKAQNETTSDDWDTLKFPEFSIALPTPEQETSNESEKENSKSPKCDHEYEEVTLNNKILFCVKYPLRNNLPSEYDLDYWRQRGDKIKMDADKFSRELDIFARTSLNFNTLEIKVEQDKGIKKKNEYCFFPIVYEQKNLYFDKSYDVEVMRIGTPCNGEDDKVSSEGLVPKQWCDQYSQQSIYTECKGIYDNIRESIENYRKSYTIKKANTTKGKEQAKKKDPGNEQELSNQAVMIGDHAVEVIFYIRAWNNGLSPKERAEKATEKIKQILDGKIDIEGLGIFEESEEKVNSENGKDNDQKTKIIKIISDSKFLNEEEKNILEVNQNDAIFEKEKDTSTLARKYLSKIVRAIRKHKNIQGQGYLVKFSAFYPFNLLDRDLFNLLDLDWFKNANKPLFSIKQELKNSFSLPIHNPSFRASLISQKIKDLAQNTFWSQDIVVASYILKDLHNMEENPQVELCILSKSLEENPIYKKFTEKHNNNNEKRKCVIKSLEEKKTPLRLIYSKEILNNLRRAEMNNSTTAEEKINDKKIIFMNLPKDYKHIMDIDQAELQCNLPEEDRQKTETTREEQEEVKKSAEWLAICSAKQINKRVNLYKTIKKAQLGITLLIIVALAWFFLNNKEISSFLKKRIFIKKRILSRFWKLSLTFLKGTKTEKTKIFRRLLLKFRWKYFVQLILSLSGIILVFFVFIALAIPKIDFFIIRIFLIFINFFETQLLNIFQYVKNELPPLIFIIVFAYFMDYILTSFIIKSIFTKIPIPIFQKVICKNDSSIESTIFIGHLIISIFVILLAAPHLPGAGTVYFAGISAFIVLAFTWSASSLISDIVSGLLLIYINPLTKGNWIKIGDVIGEIEEQNLFFHKIKTAKNCIVTIPNSVLFQNFTTNLSAPCDPHIDKQNDEQNQHSRTLILHTPVGLGYDVPREMVEHILIRAALKTDNILSDPLPFVLLTTLGDFAVTYELNVHIKKVDDIPTIYSDLHKSIQDECNSQGIEILSPNYVSIRDGRPSTIAK